MSRTSNHESRTPRSGFTLIEILIVVGVIAIVGIIAVLAVSSARSKQRDATRLGQIRQVQSALEDAFNETNTYPAGDRLPIGDAQLSACLSADGFKGNCTGDNTILLRTVTGTIDSGLKGLATCGDPARNAFCYTQLQSGAGYKIQFELENALSQVGLQKGLNCATPEGISGGKCL